jgi:feruloyl esterase
MWHSSRVGLLFILLAAGYCVGRECGSLGAVALEGAKVDEALIIRSGNVPAHCRVRITASTSPGSRIGIELWMPLADWNGRFAGVGNGGWGWSINEADLARMLKRGYAAASTDTGHTGGSASFAMGHPEKLTDFGHRAVHWMTMHAKAIVEAYYGRAPRWSYFTGCSSGGRQGLMEAQRYPEDYDGIVAGAPTNNWTNMMFGRIWVAHATLLEKDAYIPPAKYPHIHAAALAACDAADGMADGLISDPRSCRFDPGSMLCKDGDAVNCLTQSQMRAARRIYSPAVNPSTGEPIYFPMERGSELVWKTLAGGPVPIRLADEFFRYVVFEDPGWDFRSLNFDSHVDLARAKVAERLDAMDTNLAPFFRLGGKLLHYHGWTDQQVMPGNSIHYYEQVAAALGGRGIIDKSYRLFLAPGMNHCSGGEGPNEFDALAALELWVEQGTAPASLHAVQRKDGVPVRSRPLCPHPQRAFYLGRGDPNYAANFSCRVP